VQVVLVAKKSDAGVCAVAPVIVHGGTEYEGGSFNPSTAYAYRVVPYSVNPGTGAAWTQSDFNAAEFGYRRVG
jgi:hypothetical protein